MPSDDDYQIGYGRPPKSGQFPKGKSGNPRGRPKGSKSLSLIVMQEGRKPVVVNGPSGKRKMTKLEATVMQLASQAAQGDLPAARELFRLQVLAEQAVGSEANAREELGETDQRVLQMLLKHYGSNRSESQPDPKDDKEESE